MVNAGGQSIHIPNKTKRPLCGWAWLRCSSLFLRVRQVACAWLCPCPSAYASWPWRSRSFSALQTTTPTRRPSDMAQRQRCGHVARKNRYVKMEYGSERSRSTSSIICPARARAVGSVSAWCCRVQYDERHTVLHARQALNLVIRSAVQGSQSHRWELAFVHVVHVFDWRQRGGGAIAAGLGRRLGHRRLRGTAAVADSTTASAARGVPRRVFCGSAAARAGFCALVALLLLTHVSGPDRRKTVFV